MLIRFLLSKAYSFLARKLAICKHVMKPGRNWNPRICYKILGNRVRLMHSHCQTRYAPNMTKSTVRRRLFWRRLICIAHQLIYSCILQLGVGFTSRAIVCITSGSFSPSVIWTKMYLYKDEQSLIHFLWVFVEEHFLFIFTFFLIVAWGK